MERRMAQEENVFGCSHSGGGGGGGSGGGGGCRGKKIKPKKVPQRGLGVAQLEKIILEEQQKEPTLSDATSFLVRPNLSPFQNSVPLPLPLPLSLPTPSPSNLSSLNGFFRHAQLAHSIEIFQESCPVSNGISSPREGSLPRLGVDLAAEKQRLDHHGFSLGSVPHESRSRHFQPHPASIVQSGISPSSVLSSPLEPPSNQSPNHYPPQWTEEDKMVGMKRAYPFSLESPPAPPLPCDFRPSYAPSSRPDDLALCSSGYTPAAQPRYKHIRGSPLLERKPNEVTGDDESLTGDFLTLAPPSASSSSNLKNNHQPESSGSVKQSFDFFPVKSSSTNGVRNGNNEKADTIDLSLKL